MPNLIYWIMNRILACQARYLSLRLGRLINQPHFIIKLSLQSCRALNTRKQATVAARFRLKQKKSLSRRFSSLLIQVECLKSLILRITYTHEHRKIRVFLTFQTTVKNDFMLSTVNSFYYMEKSVLLGTKPLVDSIRHFIRDPSGVFSVCHLCECRIVKRRHDSRLLLLLNWFLHIIKRTLHVGSKI